MKPFRKVALTARSEIPEKEETLQRIVRIAENAGAEVSIDSQYCDVPSLKNCKRFKELRGFDLIVVLGGDGTTMRTIQGLKDFAIPLLTVNRGTVGFLAAMDTAEIGEMLPPLLAGTGVIEERQMLHCRVLRPASSERSGAGLRKRKEVLHGIALNEIVVSQGAIARLIHLKTTVGGEPLTVFRADGLIIATPTGSTAYSLSAGGPIMHPHISAIILTPINAHAFNQKPLAIPATENIEVEIPHRESTFEDFEISLTLDGQIHRSLKSGDHVLVRQHPERVRFLRSKKGTFYVTLREKLGWGEQR